MKSLSKVSLLISLSILVSACAQTQTSSSASLIITSPPSILDELIIPAEINVNRISLLTQTSDGQRLIWETSNSKTISNKGLVIRPAFGSGQKQVELTASVFNSNPKISKSFNVLVKEAPFLDLTVTKNFNFIPISVQYLPQPTSLDLHFEGDLDFPYVDIKKFVDTLEGAVESDDFSYVKAGDKFTVTFKYVDEDDGKTFIYNNTYDFTKNTLSIDSFDFFGSVSSETVTEFGKGLEVAEYKEKPSKTIVIPLGEYGFDIVQKGELNLIPFHLANQLYSGQMFNAYYNGDAVYGFDYWTKDQDLNLMRASSKGTATLSEGLKFKTYKHLGLVMDYFYGLKDLNNVSSYFNQLTNFDAGLLQGSDANHYSEVRRFVFSLGDLHSSFDLVGHYEPSLTIPLAISDFKGRAATFINAYYSPRVQDYCEVAGRNAYRLIDNGKTAVITFNGFSADNDEKTGTVETIGPLIIKAKEVDNVDNIVLNLACNTGGNVGALIRMLGYLTDELIPLHYINPTDGKTGSYSYSNEIKKVDVNWYILSSTVSFSAANMMISVAKENKFAKIIGTPSSGGASSVAPTILPSGAIITISSLSMSANKNYQSIELGITPDYLMNDFTSETELIAGIKSLG
jgi:carboxyl-terminal processing protease